MINKLKKIGLTENQAKVYLALIKMGQCTIGPIQKEVGLFKQSIYNTLDSLISQGLVQITTKNNRQYFEANDPETIVNQLKEKERTVKKLLPDLYNLSGVKQYISDIKIYGGINAFHTFHEKMLENSSPNSKLNVIGAGGDEFLKITKQKGFFTRYENMRLNKKISHKLLMYESQRNTDPAYTNRHYIEVKFLPESYNQPIATQIWENTVAILLFGENPQIIEIKSHKIREGFKNYFDILWKLGKK